MNIKTRALVAAIGICLLFGGTRPSWPHSIAPTADAASTLGDLKSIEELKTLFNEDRGKPRLVLLLSPT